MKDTPSTGFKQLERMNTTMEPLVKPSEGDETPVFDETSHRPRTEAMEGPKRKMSRDAADKVKRKTMIFGRSATSVSEESTMDISGPEQKEFNWKSRQHKGVRTTRRVKSPQKRKDSMPSLSYASFEVRQAVKYTCTCTTLVKRGAYHLIK